MEEEKKSMIKKLESINLIIEQCWRTVQVENEPFSKNIKIEMQLREINYTLKQRMAKKKNSLSVIQIALWI